MIIILFNWLIDVFFTTIIVFIVISLLVGFIFSIPIAFWLIISYFDQNEKDKILVGTTKGIPSPKAMKNYLKDRGIKIEKFKGGDLRDIENYNYRIKLIYCEEIMMNEIKTLDFNLFKANYYVFFYYSRKAYNYLSVKMHTIDRGEYTLFGIKMPRYEYEVPKNNSFKSFLKNPKDTNTDKSKSIATKKPFSSLNDDELLEVIQDYFYNKHWDNVISLKETILKEGSALWNSDRGEQQREAERKVKAISERKEALRIEAEDLKKQRIKSSTAGKLIDKSIQVVKNGACNYAGVYLIVNNKTLDFYIGESQNISFRRLTHLGQMAAPEKHHRPLIQKHYEQYGVNAFDFYVLQRVDNDTKEGTARKRIEEFYIKEYKPTYNNDF